MKKKVRFITGSINILILFILTFIIYLNVVLPDSYTIVKGEKVTIKGNSHLTIDINNLSSKKNIISNYFHSNSTNMMQLKRHSPIVTQDNTICANINADDPSPSLNFGISGFSDEFQEASTGDNFETFLRAYSILPIKPVEIKTIDRVEVYPCGIPFGIKMFTKGVMVVGMGEVEKGIIPSKEAGIKLGDMIVSINDTPVYSNGDIAQILNESNGKEILIKIIRNDIEHLFKLTPQKSLTENTYKAGMWVRNSTAGIGTLTFYCEDGFFGGLGHPVCDVDTGQIMPLLSGEIIGVNISGVNRGEIGSPGELKGTFTEDNNLGVLIKNTFSGVYGKLINTSQIKKFPKVPVAIRQEIEEGPAKILSTIDGTNPEMFDVTIQRINYNNINPCKNMIIKITDDRLIEKTGGIVQGMSGSPIIQNGKMIGAVTHVFVNQPLKGYAIFAENMLDNLPAIN